MDSAPPRLEDLTKGAGTGFRTGVTNKIAGQTFRRLERVHDFSICAEVHESRSRACGADGAAYPGNGPASAEPWSCGNREIAAGTGRARSSRAFGLAKFRLRAALAVAVSASFLAVFLPGTLAQIPAKAASEMQQRPGLPPQVLRAQRFLAARSWGVAPGIHVGPTSRPMFLSPAAARLQASASAATLNTAAAFSPAAATWQPLGPAAVNTPGFGLVGGRVTALVLDPSDATGNRLYVGTTGGGVWEAQNAAASSISSIIFSPLTDTLDALGGVLGASISIGALTVQPGGTGVILAGTGDPNDALDSYYGAGILRSIDGGATWTLVQTTVDREEALGPRDYNFVGEGFAGFAWSSVNPQVVVAAVSQAFEGTLVSADQPGKSYEGLYYSTDAGASWHLATVMDLNGQDVQSPTQTPAAPDGNAATAVVWNPVRKLFLAAVRYHGYYQSADGVTWTRLSTQPGAGLTTALCPTNPTGVGSIACPIFRGALAVNPQTGDTFAWTTDINNQDQGLWQDQCALSSGACSNPAVTFARQWSTAALEVNSPSGAATIPNGDYNLVLAAVPSQQDTLLLAGANDLWKCSLAAGCVWRNTTNATTCRSAQVGEFQHALTWNASNPLEIFAGNDSGLWRSTDAIGETGAICSATDASHFQNLNGGLGSLLEPESIAQGTQTSYTMLAGLGVNGAAGVKSSVGPTTDWPQVLSGEGGPVDIDPQNPSNWYVNNGVGVSIHACTQASSCTPADFGANPAVSNSDVGGDGYSMTTAAPFLVDPVDDGQLLIGTCRVWRGPANGFGWSASNAISPILDTGAVGSTCNGDATIRSLAALALPGGGEVIYAGMYGALDGGANVPGHIYRATVNNLGTGMPVWQDLTLNPVTNSGIPLNQDGFDISSIYIDPHDATGNTVYFTLEGMNIPLSNRYTIFRSTDGGGHWYEISSNIPKAPANSVVVDPGDANTVYVATDSGVYFTTQISTCSQNGSNCWSAFGTGLPQAPVVALSAAQPGAAQQVLVAATYGRGIWQTPLWVSSPTLTTVSANPVALSFAAQNAGTASSPQPVTLYNTGTTDLAISAIAVVGDFSESDNCRNGVIAAGASCTIQVVFAPTAAGSTTGQLEISANVYGGQFTVDLSGTGLPPAIVSVSPATLDFGYVATGTSSTPLAISISNASSDAVPISNISITAPFQLVSNSCGTSSLAANSTCQIQIGFSPQQSGAVTGTFALSDSYGVQTVSLSGAGGSAATDSLSTASVAFPDTITGQLSPSQVVQLTNSGDAPLTSISATATAGFQIASNNCTTQLIGHASCAIAVAFAPAQPGAQSGTLTVSDALRTQVVTLAGTGLAPPVIGISPSSLTFAQQQTGTSSPPQTVTVTNNGGAAMANVSLQISGTGASSFSVGASTCGATLAAGADCTAQVTFTPSAGGGIAATLTVTSSTLGVNPASIPLNGSAQFASGLSVSPVQLAFPAVNPGQTSAAQTVTITNTAGVSIDSLSLALSPQFVLTQNTCTGSLAAGAQCTAAIAFSPVSSAAATGTLTISSPSAGTLASVALSGSGGIQVAPASITFPATGAGTVSSPATLTVTNLSTTDAQSNLLLVVPAGFQLVSNTCGATLPAQSSCTAGVQFAPAVAGQQTGSLTVTTSTLQAAPVALSGMGFDFTAAVSGSSSQTVAGGQTASYTLSLSSLNGSQGSLSFACGSLPAHALCVFNPATESLVAGAPGNVTVSISTGQATAAAEAPAGPWRALPLLCSLILLPLAGRRRRALLLVALLAVVLCFGASACTSSGGGSSIGGGTGGQGSGSGTTPAGTYSIDLTASSLGVQHTVTVKLIVD